MELILISRNKLKVMLTAEDMSAYSLSCDSIDYDNTQTRRAFWSILDSAKHQTGFDAAGNRVFIQVFPSKGGGCELFVTKLAREVHEEHPLSTNAGEDENRCRVKLYARGSHSLSLPSEEEIRELYGFRKLEDMLTACGLLMRSGYDGEGSAYYSGERACYFLSLPEREEGYPWLCEYGVRYDNPRLLPALDEHCACLCREGAVAALARLSL